MVFVYPVQYGLYHIFAHHRAVARRFVAACSGICKTAVRSLTIEISGNGTLEIALGRIESVIVHHVQHYADACLMQGLHHLFELTDTHIRFIRVGSVRAVGHIVILRVIPPVVFVLVQSGFVYRGIIIGRKDVHMRHSQFFQVVDTGCQLVRIYRTRFRHCKELAFVPNARRRVYGEVTVVYLVDYHIGRRCQRRTFIFRPAFRVGFPHIDNSRTLTVYTYSLRIDARRIAQPFSVDFYIESIELAFQILLHLSRPRTVFGGRHGNRFVRMSALSRIIQHQTHFIRSRRPKRKLRGSRSIFHFCQTARTDRIEFVRRVFFL